MDFAAQEKIEAEKVETSENGVDSASQKPPVIQAEVEEVIGKPVLLANSETVFGFGGCPAGYHRVGPVCVPDDQ